jgi:hypothetical protein
MMLGKTFSIPRTAIFPESAEAHSAVMNFRSTGRAQQNVQGWMKYLILIIKQ